MTNIQPSIAVLPLVSRSPDPEDDYISDGMTEDLILSLSKVPGLKVSALTSSFTFKGKQIDIREIGEKLGVENILEGSIRKAGKHLRISLQLINVKDGFCLWSERYNRELEDLFALQDEISLNVADQIRENFGHLQIADQLVEKPTQNIQAYEHYLKGRQQMRFWTGDSMASAVEHHKAAIAEDPKFGKAYVEIAWGYFMLIAWQFIDAKDHLDLAHSYARKAKVLIGDSSEYYYLMATESMWMDWDFSNTRHYLEKCLELEPKNSMYLESMAECCLAVGRLEAGMHYINQSLEIDPLSPNHVFTKGRLFDLMEKPEEALVYYERTHELNPDFELAYGHKAQILIHLKREAELQEWVKHCQEPEMILKLYQVYHASKEERALFSLDKLSANYGLFPWKTYILAQSPDSTIAAQALREVVEMKLGSCINYRFDPFLKHLSNLTELSDLYPQMPNKEEVLKAEPSKEEDRIDQEFLKVLEDFIKEEKAYLNPRLSLRDLAASLECSPNFLSYQINNGLQLNFNEYLNGFRLKCFQQKALDPENKNLTLLALAYDSGFNTKSVFNDFFKKSTGLSPRAWLKGQEA